MKYLLLVTLFLTASFVIFAQPDIPLDSSLKNNSQYWKVKIKQKLALKYRPAAVSFGPVKTVETSAEKAKLVSKEKNNGIFWKARKTKSSRECDLTITYDEKDTISIDILSIITDENEYTTTVGKMFSIGDNSLEGRSSSSSWADEMVIQLQGDTAIWHFERTSNVSANSNDIITYAGVLWCGIDTFTIRSSDNFSGQKFKKILFSTPAGGLVIYDKDKQVAALQYLMKNAVWLSPDIDFRKRKVLLAIITGFLATYNSNPH